MLSIQERLGLLTEPIEGAAWQWACALRVATPGIVVSFDPVKQTCVVQPSIQEIVLKPSPGSKTFTQNIPTSETIKPVQDCLIFMMRVPGYSITLPIVPGTECLLIFADMCIDGWWQTGQVSPQYDRRRHDLSDAIAFFGPWSQPKVLQNYSTDSLQIRSDDGTVIIDVSPTGVRLTGPAVDAISVGGTPLALVNDNFYQWFITTFMPSVQYTGGPPSPPLNPETTVLKGQ